MREGRRPHEALAGRTEAAARRGHDIALLQDLRTETRIGDSLRVAASTCLLFTLCQACIVLFIQGGMHGHRLANHR